jgi:glycosyltransferase involved in cell wall biosynthesis
MRVAVVTEHRFGSTPQGFFTSGPFAYSFWKRYLAAFDSVRVVARAADLDRVPPQRPGGGLAQGARADGPGVAFAPVPYYRGPEQLLRNLRRVRRAVVAALEESDAILLRLPSALASVAEGWLRGCGRPFAVEVVGDPWDALAPGAHYHPLRALFRQALFRSQRRQCAASCASSYVTREALQRRYPARLASLSVGCSDVELPHSAFAEQPRSPSSALRQPSLVTVGSLNHLYKGPDVLLEAVGRCRRVGLDASLAVVGDGQYRPALEASCRRLGIASRVVFRGQLAFGEDVRAELDRADLFVLPSRQEGLPRALLEAMARGLPALGSSVGGIPELLAPEDLVSPNDPAALARKIEEVCGDPARLERMSRGNLATSWEYEDGQLEQQRKVFLKRLCKETERWVDGRNSPRKAQSPHGRPSNQTRNPRDSELPPVA